MSVTSWGARSLSEGRAERVVSVERLAVPAPPVPATRVGRVWGNWMTGAPVLFVTVYPQPAWPYNITPYIFVVAMFLGFIYMKWRESTNPGALDRAAAMITRAGDVAE